MLIFSDRVVCTDKNTSTLNKASALNCTTVWPAEPSWNIVWQDVMEWFRFDDY